MDHIRWVRNYSSKHLNFLTIMFRHLSKSTPNDIEFNHAASDGGTDEQRRAAAMLGFRPKNVTPDMVRASQSSISHLANLAGFADQQRLGHVPRYPNVRPSPILDDAILKYSLRPNVHYDLLRTGNVELTTNRILERGFLESVCLPIVQAGQGLDSPHCTTASTSIPHTLPFVKPDPKLTHSISLRFNDACTTQSCTT